MGETKRNRLPRMRETCTHTRNHTRRTYICPIQERTQVMQCYSIKCEKPPQFIIIGGCINMHIFDHAYCEDCARLMMNNPIACNTCFRELDELYEINYIPERDQKRYNVLLHLAGLRMRRTRYLHCPHRMLFRSHTAKTALPETHRRISSTPGYLPRP
jgi:hypothetical protein